MTPSLSLSFHLFFPNIWPVWHTIEAKFSYNNVEHDAIGIIIFHPPPTPHSRPHPTFNFVDFSFVSFIFFLVLTPFFSPRPFVVPSFLRKNRNFVFYVTKVFFFNSQLCVDYYYYSSNGTLGGTQYSKLTTSVLNNCFELTWFVCLCEFWKNKIRDIFNGNRELRFFREPAAELLFRSVSSRFLERQPLACAVISVCVCTVLLSNSYLDYLSHPSKKQKQAELLLLHFKSFWF